MSNFSLLEYTTPGDFIVDQSGHSVVTEHGVRIASVNARAHLPNEKYWHELKANTRLMSFAKQMYLLIGQVRVADNEQAFLHCMGEAKELLRNMEIPETVKVGP